MEILLIYLISLFGQMQAKLLGDSMLNRPIVIGALTGLVMGDFGTGLLIGGSLELAWMGLITFSVSMPAEVVTGSIIGVYYAITTNSGFEVAVAIALPAGMLASYINTLLHSAFTPILLGYVDKHTEKGEIDKINRAHLIYGIVRGAIVAAIPVLFILLGSNAIEVLVSSIPERLMSGLYVVSGVLPAVGFAMLLNIMWDKRYLPLFFVGFIVSAYFGVNIIALSLIALCLALFKMFATEKKEENQYE